VLLLLMMLLLVIDLEEPCSDRANWPSTLSNEFPRHAVFFCIRTEAMSSLWLGRHRRQCIHRSRSDCSLRRGCIGHRLCAHILGSQNVELPDMLFDTFLPSALECHGFIVIVIRQATSFSSILVIPPTGCSQPRYIVCGLTHCGCGALLQI